MAFVDDGFGQRRPEVRFRAIGVGWRLFKAQWPTWAFAGLIVMLGNWILFGALKTVFDLRLSNPGAVFQIKVPPARALVPAVVMAVANGIFLGGMFRLACRQVRDQRFRASDVFGVIDVLPELALGSAIWGVCLFGAAIFCAGIPAFILAGVWMFMIPLIVDARLRAVDALGQSWHALKGRWASAAVFHFILSVIVGFGSACFCLGVFITMPLYCLSIAVLYRDFFPLKGVGGTAKPANPDPYF